MNTPDLSRAVWRKSTWSGGNGGQCVEVAVLDGDSVGVRDSKGKSNGPVLVFTAREWSVFVTGAVGGGLDVKR
jgi:hypothetical protein